MELKKEERQCKNMSLARKEKVNEMRAWNYQL
jgi:hypothetical protein